MHEGRPVAVQKNIGEPSVYALETNRSLGLIERTFAAPLRPLRPSSIATDEPVVKADAAYYGSFSPRRQTSSVFSGRMRELETYIADGDIEYEAFIAFDHEAIIDAVSAAVQNTTATVVWRGAFSSKE
jgi:hypothetical protein